MAGLCTPLPTLRRCPHGQRRTALVYRNTASVPKTSAPLLLVFHGHGGRVEGTARRFNLTLVGFLRSSRFNVYSSPERLSP